MASASKVILIGILAASAATADAQPPGTTGTDQVEHDADSVDARDVRPPGQVQVRPTITRKAVEPEALWGGGVRLTGLSGIGALPGVNIGAEVAVFVRRDEHFLELALGRWVPEDTYVVAETPQRVELGLDVWSLRGGWASRTMPLRVWLLAETGELAAGPKRMTGMIARMVGAVEKDHRWLAAGGGFGVAWPMSDRARLIGTVELAVPIDRNPMMTMTGQAFQPDAAAARCSLGIEVGWR